MSKDNSRRESLVNSSKPYFDSMIKIKDHDHNHDGHSHNPDAHSHGHLHSQTPNVSKFDHDHNEYSLKVSPRLKQSNIYRLITIR